MLRSAAGCERRFPALVADCTLRRNSVPWRFEFSTKSSRKNTDSGRRCHIAFLNEKALAMHRAGALIDTIDARPQPFEVRRDFAIDRGLDRSGRRLMKFSWRRS